MYPLRNNLLSPRKKALIKRMTHIQFVKSLLEILLIFVSIIGIVLLGAQYVLEDYFSQLTSNTVSINNEHAEEIRDIMRINQLISNTQTIQKDYTLWSPIVHDMLKATTYEGVTLSTLTFDKTHKTLTVIGSAQTRELFLAFEKQLSETPALSNIATPISSLTQKENIPFSITATLDISIYEK